MVSKNDLMTICHLRQDARQNLTKISRKTNIPVSTLYYRLKWYEKDIIKKHTCLLNYGSLGFNTKVNMMIKSNKEEKEAVKEYLVKNYNVNSVYAVNDKNSFMIAAIFRDMKELYCFVESLEDKFRIKKDIFYIIEEIKEEDFLTSPSLLGIFP